MTSLHLLCGLPGAGKTTLAKKLELDISAVRFCPDDWIVRLLSDPLDSKERDRLRDIVEGLQWDLAQNLLNLGTSVVLENGFWSKVERMQYRKAAETLGAKVTLHYLALSFDDLWARVSKRNENLPENNFFVSKEDLRQYYDMFEVPSQEELALNHA